MLNVIMFIIGFVFAIFVLALARACDDKIDNIILLKSVWLKYKNNQASIDEIDKIINNL